MNRPLETIIMSYLTWVLQHKALNEIPQEKISDYENIIMVIDKIRNPEKKGLIARVREYPKEGFLLPEDCSENLVFI